MLFYRKSANFPWLLLFGILSAASFLGGTVHGFLPDESSTGYGVLWRLSLISTGGVALAGWYIGADLLQNRSIAAWIKKAALLQFILFAAVVNFYSQKFLFAALNYLPAALFLLIIFTRGYLKTRLPAFWWGALSIVLTFVGSFVQIARIALHPDYFNHNALYHAIQFVAICLLVTAAWTIEEGKPCVKSMISREDEVVRLKQTR